MVRPRSAEAMTSSTSSSNNDFTRVMGERLLAGWTLLAETCPRDTCNAPLMRDRSMVVHCCSCNAVIQSGPTQEDVPPSPSHHPNATPVAGSPVRPAADSTAPPGAFDAAEEDDDAPDARAFPSYSSSGNRVLERAFAAYMESAAEAAGVDVSEYAATAPLDTVVSNTPPPAPTPAPAATTASTASNADGDGEEEEEDDTAAIEAAAAADAARMRASAAGRGGQADEIAGLLGEKMLGGWALLEEQCPSCEGVPLVRDRQGTMLCVGCNTQVVTRDEFDPSKHTDLSAPAAPTTAQVPAPTPQPTASAPTTTTTTISAAASSAPAPMASTTPAPSSAVSPTTPAASTMSVRPLSAAAQASLATAEQALANKLNEVSATLQSLPVSSVQEVGDLTMYTVAIQSLAGAMKSLQ